MNSLQLIHSVSYFLSALTICVQKHWGKIQAGYDRIFCHIFTRICVYRTHHLTMVSLERSADELKIFPQVSLSWKEIGALLSYFNNTYTLIVNTVQYTIHSILYWFNSMVILFNGETSMHPHTDAYLHRFLFLYLTLLYLNIFASNPVSFPFISM